MIRVDAVPILIQDMVLQLTNTKNSANSRYNYYQSLVNIRAFIDRELTKYEAFTREHKDKS